MKHGRTLACLLLAALAVRPGLAQAQASPAGIVAAPPDPLGEIEARLRAERERCRSMGQGLGDDDVVVCGRPRIVGGGYRVPFAPEDGARIRLVAGEAPSATGAMAADRCLRLCLQPVQVNIMKTLGTIVRGIDNLLND